MMQMGDPRCATPYPPWQERLTGMPVVLESHGPAIVGKRAVAQSLLPDTH